MAWCPPGRASKRALASLLLHDPQDWLHVGGNTAILALVGTRVEQAIGSLRFAAVFVFGGVSGAALHLVADPASAVPLVGFSGALFAIIAVAATLFGPAMLGFVVALTAINIAHAFGAPGADGVSFGAHLGGFTLGAVAVGFARIRGIDLRLAELASIERGNLD